MRRIPPLLLCFVPGVSILVACGKAPTPGPGTDDPIQAESKPSEPITIDGSSTVHPILEAVAEEFQKGHSARVTIGVSGTGGGFKKLCAGETAIAGASRPIKPAEVDACKAAGIDWTELPIAYDGLAVVAHPDARWLDHLTTAELKLLWAPEAQGAVTTWKQVRASFPDDPIHLFGPGVDSGTYDYFTRAIVGTEHSSRGDYTASEDDNVLVQGVAMEPRALGFFGYAYYAQNASRLRLVPIDDGNAENGAGPIAPSPDTIRNGSYQPLSRPLFVYVAQDQASRKEVAEFLRYAFTDGRKLVTEIGYVPLPDAAYELSLKRLENRVTGSLFGGNGSAVGLTVDALLRAEQAPRTP